MWDNQNYYSGLGLKCRLTNEITAAGFLHFLGFLYA